MTTPPAEPPPAGPDPGAASGPPSGPAAADGQPAGDLGHGPRVTTQQMRDVTRLRRTILGDRWIGGVAGGLARHFDVDPVIVRVAFVVLALFGGSGVLLYGALWLLLPEDGAESAVIKLDERSLGVALVGVGVVAGLALLGTWSDARWVSWPLALVALVVLLVASSRERRPTAYPPTTYPPTTYPPGYQTPPPGTPAAAAPPPAYAGPTSPGAPMTTTPTTDAPAGAPTQTAVLPPAPPFPPSGTGWTPQQPPPPPLRDPRRRGPLLVWFTLALMALGVGILGMVDVAGSDIPASAYPALATAIAGVMLLVGAFYGRAGGIIFLGLVSATVLAGTTIGERIETDQSVVRPTAASEVDGTYSQAAGELVYDFSDVTDLAELDGRTVTLEQGAGRVEVIVPRGIDVVATTSIGAGSAKVFDTTRDGLGIDFTTRRDVADEVATVNLDVELGLGEVVVRVDPITPIPAEETR